MEMAYRLILYIIIANVGFMIFSLIGKGFKHYSGYISELFFLLCLMIVFIIKGFAGGWAIIISLAGIGLLVLLPMFLQQQIDLLVSENRLEEIEPLAKWKADIAWSELNIHMHTLSKVIAENFENIDVTVAELKKLLGKEAIYDDLTNSFINLIYFNNRNFAGLIDNIISPDKDFAEYSFDNLLYLVRAFLETTRYDDALKAQLALERACVENELDLNKFANCLISRMIFFAFMGWIEDFKLLIEQKHQPIEQLPDILNSFWLGVATFNSGDYETGQSLMAKSISACGNDDENPWLPFMRQRYHGLVENKDFFDESVLPKLQKLREFGSPKIASISTSVPENFVDKDLPELTDKTTNILTWITLIVSVSIIMSRDMGDVVNLVNMGANSSYLVNSGQYYRLFTYQFIHMGWLHLMMNMIALKYFGPPVETVLGAPVYLFLYFFSGICGGLATVYFGQTISVGASAAILGLLSATIVFELFKVKGIKVAEKNNSFSTLVFILVVNLIIGVVEPIIDNSAHIGGLIGGALLAIVLTLVYKSKIAKKIVSKLSILFLVALIAFSAVQINQFNGNSQYPVSYGKSREISNASDTISLLAPESWKKIRGNSSPNKLRLTGPFHEKLIVTFAINNEVPKAFVDEFIEQNTKSLTAEDGIEIKLRKGPNIYNSGTKGKAFQVCWFIEAQGQNMIEKDYLMFEGKLLYVVRFYVGTKYADVYKHLMESIVNSIKPGKSVESFLNFFK